MGRRAYRRCPVDLALQGRAAQAWGRLTPEGSPGPGHPLLGLSALQVQGWLLAVVAVAVVVAVTIIDACRLVFSRRAGVPAGLDA